ncbi:nitrile hydratase accessory protein [Caenispirillum bisanense]|uniref:Nitrile hydratase accessory protein n=1 Tax=Caenispirillum bisanense TaxID=414052 RepID=A0A286GRI9_9PROT|nr:nitrile hydratase accessory protein [Caenispirillum bisanense]SOD98112.1 nitrile hydratase accessory protein [Caenispirillum bisanense]
MPSDATAPTPVPERPFAEPWQAQAFAVAVHLSQRGLFTWTEWTETFGATLAMARAAGQPDTDGSAYWRHWVTALEVMLAARDVADKDTLEALKAAWADAYRATPHGEPVRLKGG